MRRTTTGVGELGLIYDVMYGNIDALKKRPVDTLKREEDNYEMRNNLLHIAVEVENLDSVKYLLEIGVDKDKKNRLGKTPFDLALRTQDKELIELFIKHSKASVEKEKAELNIENGNLKKEIMIVNKHNKRLREDNDKLRKDNDELTESNRAMIASFKKKR